MTVRTVLNRSEQQALFDIVLDRFARAGLTFREEAMVLLVADIAALATEESEWNEALFEDVCAEWWRRIGGARNVAAYLATLEAGQRRRQNR